MNKCDICDEEVEADEDYQRPNPYIEEVQGRELMQFICKSCYHQLCLEV